MIRTLRHTETRVVLSLLALLGVCEASMRLYGVRLSKDIQHLEQLDEIAARIAAPASGGETRVLFLGNSLTRFGVDPEEFARAAAEQGLAPLRIEKIMPDNTALADWYYAYRAFFAAEDRAPDLLVIGFQGGHLRDAASQHPERLARFYCRPEDFPELCARDLLTFESRAGFGAASLSALICNRDRIESRVLARLIPGYEEGIQELNRRVRGGESTINTAAPAYDRLRRLLDVAAEDGVRVVLAAMPVPQSYEIDPELPRLAAECGARLIDCRHVPGVSADMFPDGLHMDAGAARLYSRYLAGQLGRPAVVAHRTP